MFECLRLQLLKALSVAEKISILDALPLVEACQTKYPFLRTLLSDLSLESEVAFKEMIAIGGADALFEGVDASNFHRERLRELLGNLVTIDYFYRELGGIVGYQMKILELLKDRLESPVSATPGSVYHSPSFLDIAEETAAVKEAIEWGIEMLPQIAEIYPLGGAADRLHLVDAQTGLELPAAKLQFAGKTLLEHLIRDLEAREYLYFQRYGKQIATPIAIMTSREKNNHAHVVQICEELHWFGRPKDSIRFFTQPLVPTVNSKGEWCSTGPLKPLLKPGGHGVIWKLARDEGVFAWLEKQGRKKALIRQINNPIAGLDYGLLAFAGIGCKKKMIFGFASCPRLLQAAEGVNVLIERKRQIVLTNIEYCDFAKFGIADRPLKEGEPYSRFSSNTNILFADLTAISKAVDACPFPGLLIHFKKGNYTTESGESKEEPMARLESTMQNIADVFVEKKGATLKTKRTFVTYNRRCKTISTAKKAFIPGQSLQETPEQCFFDLLFANRNLLLTCGYQLPLARTLEEYIQKGPDCLFLYHPALGPLYASIRKKLCDGLLTLGSELLLELSDFKAVNLKVQGSLQVIAEQVTGHRDENNIFHYSNRVGTCILENVTIENKGINWERSRPFWKMEPDRQESCKIILKGQSTFSAKNVCLKGNQTFIVENGKNIQIE